MAVERKLSAENLAYEKIKDALCQRKFGPGTKLLEQSLSTALKMSRTPIRQALKRLAQEGYVEIVPNRGAFVAQPDITDIRELYDVRIELEIFALRLGIEAFTEEDFRFLEELIEQEYRAFETRNFSAYMEANRSFHTTIVDKADNHYLSDIFENIYQHMDTFLTLYDNFYVQLGRDIRSIQAHREMVKAIREKNQEHFGEMVQKLCNDTYEEYKNRYVPCENIYAILSLGDEAETQDVRFTL